MIFFESEFCMKVTIEEIAKISGVSKATVSRVVNNVPYGVSDETRQRIMKILDEMGYRQDSYSGLMRSRSIALVVPDITNPFFADLAKVIEQTASENNYIVIIANTDFSESKEKDYITKLIAKKVDGIILVSSLQAVSAEHMLPRKYNIPLYLLDRSLENNQDIPGVYSDTEYASFMACEAMIRSGHREIAFIGGQRGSFTAAERFNGYRLALKHYKLPINEALVCNGNYTLESGYSAVVDLVKEGQAFSGILAANDLMAMGAIKALREMSFSIPDEVQVIGFDNILYAQMCDPPLSTFQQPTIEMGKRAFESILKMINGENVEKSIKLQPRLISRKTTK